MREGQPSRTAERVALERAAHQLLDSPLVLDDPFALRVIAGAQRLELEANPGQHDRSPMSKPTRALVVARTRAAEDELAASHAKQYVLLGAGLDTFAYRNPFADVRVFEVDQPDTQALKRERVALAGMTPPPNLSYAPCDFSRDSLARALAAAGFNRDRPAVFAWLGVVMYLELDDVLETLRYIVTVPPPSAVVFDYALSPRRFSWPARKFYEHVLDRLEEQGEPWKTFLEPDSLAQTLHTIGFSAVDDLGPEEINARYLADRADGLKLSLIHI